MLPTQGGNTLVYTGTIAPTGSAFPAGTSFTVKSNDPTVSPKVDDTGLVVTIPLPAGWEENQSIPLAITWSTSTFVANPATAPAALTAVITPNAPPSILTPTSITFAQTQ